MNEANTLITGANGYYGYCLVRFGPIKRFFKFGDDGVPLLELHGENFLWSPGADASSSDRCREEVHDVKFLKCFGRISRGASVNMA